MKGDKDESEIDLRYVENNLEMIERRGIEIEVEKEKEDVILVGRKRGRIEVVGIGKGESEMMKNEVKREMEKEEDIMG